MSQLTIHEASVPVFARYLGQLSAMLALAERHAAGHGLHPSALLQARLSPSMYPLAKQVQIAAGFALQDAGTATTVRWSGGRASRVDGPFAETKEMLGGILVLEAKDKAEALRIMSRHPGIRMGPFEIRPADEAFMAQHPVMQKLEEKGR